MIKKTAIVLFSLIACGFSLFAIPARAADEAIICPQPYGGGVVCGVKTHEPVNTGLGENLALIGAGLLVSSLGFLAVSKKFQKISA